MSDQNKAVETVEVPRELVDRLLGWTATNKDLFCDLHDCIKPRRWERQEWFAVRDGHEFPYIVSEHVAGAFRCRIIWEEIV